MKQTVLHLLLITVVASLILFTNLGQARLWDRDEPRNAGCALEMMQRGDVVVPMFNDELRHQKPVLLYWLIISAYNLFGVNEFAARFWSALLAVGTVCSTYAIGRRLLNPTVALIGAIVLASSVMFAVAGRAATPDSALIFCSTLAIMFYVLGTFSPRKKSADASRMLWPGYYFPQNNGYVVAMYTAMGIGVLAKGPVAVVVPCAIIGMFMLVQSLPVIDNERWNARGWLTRIAVATLRPFHPLHFLKTVWKMRPLTAALVILVIAAPWYVLVGIRTEGEFLRMFFVGEHFGRATHTLENHGGGLWYYPLAILLGFFPWSVFIGPTFYGVDRQLTKRHHWSASYSFLLCWIGVQIGLFTLAQTKLPSYVTPCYPALALLTAVCLYRMANRQKWAPAVLHRLALISLTAAGIGLAIVLGVVSKKFFDGDQLISLFGVGLGVGGLLGWWLYRRSQFRAVVVTCSITAVMFTGTLFGFGTVFVDQFQHSDVVLRRVADSNQQTAVGTFGCLESSWIFYGGKPVFELTRETRSDWWNDQRRGGWHKKDWPSPEQFVAAKPGALIITTDRDVQALQQRLPPDYRVLERAKYFLRDKEMVLLGPASMTAAEPTATRHR